MAKYLIFAPPFFGHINPTLGIGRELIQRGHMVTWVGLSEVDPAIFPNGGQYIFPSVYRKHSDQIQDIIDKQEEGIGLSVNKALKWSFETTWLPIYSIMKDGITEVIQLEQPDIIIHDEGILAAPIAAHQLSIPCITSITTRPGIHYPESLLLTEDYQWLQSAMKNLLEENDLNNDLPLFNSTQLNLIYSSKEFCDGHTFPERYSFVGPIINGRSAVSTFDWSQLKNLSTPLVFVSTGSLLKGIKKAFYKKVIDAFENQPITILLTADPDTFDEWPSNIKPQAFWPQIDLLPRVDAVVSPGGFNTINESLYFGKPLLIIPLVNDQIGNSLLIEKMRCGLRLRYRRTTSTQLRISVMELLHNEAIRTTVNEHKNLLRSAGGEQRAVDLIEKVNAKSGDCATTIENTNPNNYV